MNLFTTNTLFFFVCLVALLSTSQALYSPKSKVVQVNDEAAFSKEVSKSKGIVFVEFYAPWCGHCKNLAPEWEKAANILDGVIKVVAVDATVAQSLGQKYQVQGYPTIKVFGEDKKSPTDYQGQRTADGIVSEAMKLTNKLVKDRKAGKSKGKSSSTGSKPKAKKSKGGSDVVTLTDANFNKLVMDSPDHWLVEFYAPWCGHCKNLAPEWEAAATALKSQNVKLGAIDATVETNLASQYGIKGFPTIKIFGAGTKEKPQDYNGPRDADGITQFALSTLEAANVPVVIKQVVDSETFEDVAQSKLTAILFLPHILDSQAEGRNAYLANFEEVAKNFRTMPFSFAWIEANAQPDLENIVSVNGNFPTVVVMNMEKKMYAAMKVSWSVKNIKNFIQGVLSGTEKSSALSSIPTINKSEPWDGKDAVMEVEEMSLDELFGDDL